MIFFYIIFLFIFSFNLFSQDFNVRIIKTNPDYYPRLITSLQVYDMNDEPIKDLKAENFSISINGKPTDSVDVFTYKESGKGLNIMLCLDLSGTMSGKPLQTMKNAVLRYLDEMRNVDKLAIIGFADSYELISDFSSDKNYLKKKVQELTTSGTKTALYYAAYQGLIKLRDNKDMAGKILLLIGDGKDETTASSYNLEDVINLAKNEGIPIFTIGYSKIDKSYLRILEKMSEQTGGKFYDSPSDDDLQKQYNKLYEQILNIYILSYTVLDLPGDGSEYTNVITVSHRNSKKTVSNKFISPAGIPAYHKTIQFTKDKENTIIYYLIALGVVFLLVILFLYKSRKKKNIGETTTQADEIQNTKVHSTQIENSTTFNGNNETEIIQSTGNDLTTIIESDDKTKIVRTDSSLTLKLEILTGKFAGKSFYLQGKGGIIGRQDGNDIVIKEENISRKHAKITFNNGNFFIEDLNSSNGTYINGVRISQIIKINNYDTFKFGSCEGRFIIS